MSKVRRQKQIIRNDDVSVDTEMEDIKWFSELCDKYGYRVLQCITVIGETHDIDVRMSNNTIKDISDKLVLDNKELIEFLQGRNDLIAVHGLWHTHQPSRDEIEFAKSILKDNGLRATYFVPPFNEGDYGEKVCGLKVSAMTQRLEDYLDGGIPTDEIVYLHSWRFGDWYPKEKLELCMMSLSKGEEVKSTTE